MAEHHIGGAAGNYPSVVPLSRRAGEIKEYQDPAREGAAGPLPEETSAFNLLHMMRVLLKWWWLFLAIIMLCVLAGGLWAFLTTPLYKAGATLELNPEPTKVVQLGESAEPSTPDRDFLALQMGLIKSRAVAERVARQLNLRSDEQFLSSDVPAPASEDVVVAKLAEGFSATGTASDRLMQISFVHPNPRVAARVTNGFAQSFIESNLERQFDSTAYSRKYLQQRLSGTREKLEKSEADLMAYARDANILNIVASDGASSTEAAGSSLAATNLMALSQQLADAQNARIAAEQRYRQAGGSNAAAALTNPLVQSLEQQRAEVRAEYQKGIQTYGPEHPEMVALSSQIEGLGRQIAQAKSNTSSATTEALRADYLAAVNRERQLETKIGQLESQVMDLGDRSIKYNILKREVEANRTLYNALLQSLREVDTSATKSTNVSVVDDAEVPQAPFTPNIPGSLALALLAGIVLGASAAYAADYLDDTIKVPEDFETKLGLALVGVVPKIANGEKMEEALADPRSPISEAYYSARTALQFSTAHGIPKSLFVTSSRAAEGKSTSSLAIASAFATLGLDVLLVDSDLRNPSLLPEKQDAKGLVGLLVGETTIETAVLPTRVRGLFLLPAGPIPPNPANLLGSSALRDIVANLSEAFDVVVIDGPPVLGLADAPLIASVCEATVLVCEAGKTRTGGAANAISRLRTSGASIIGGILTKFSYKSLGYGYDDYSYAYGGDTSSDKRATRRLTVRQPEQPPSA